MFGAVTCNGMRLNVQSGTMLSSTGGYSGQWLRGSQGISNCRSFAVSAEVFNGNTPAPTEYSNLSNKSLRVGFYFV